jgi:hypothetical protein
MNAKSPTPPKGTTKAAAPKAAGKLGASLGALLLGLLAFLADRMGLLAGGSSVLGGGNNTSSAPTAGQESGAPTSKPPTPAPAPTPAAKPTPAKAPTKAEASQAAPAAADAGTSEALFHGIKRSVYEQGLAKVENAFDKQLNDVLIECAGVVVHLLPDDTEGSQHQLFLVELANDITLKVAHNIDLAPRVPVERGDWIAFYGEYEWNDKGGVIHWTHHDPAGRHPDGWLLHRGETYQ